MEPTNQRTVQEHHGNPGRHRVHDNPGDQGRPRDDPTVTLNVLLLGAAQSGRSSVGNALIGGGEFRAGLSGGSVTRECSVRCRTFGKFFRRRGAETDLRLRVMDTPPLEAGGGARGGVREGVREGVRGAFLEGVHAGVLVVRADVPLQNTHLQHSVQAVLGPGWRSHSMLVLTHADRLREAGLRREDYLTQASDSLRALVEMVGGRYLFLNTSSDWPEKEGRPLRDCLLTLSAQNRHTALTNQHLDM